MSTYLSLFLFTSFSALLSVFRKIPARPLAISVFIVIVLFVGLRYDSVDYGSYQNIYNQTETLGFNEGHEPGFLAFVIAEQALTSNFFVFIFFFSLASISIKYYGFSKLAPYTVLSLLIYVSTSAIWKDMGQIRNGMAAGILLLSMYFAYRREPRRFILAVLCATLFHTSAVIGFLIYFFQWAGNRVWLSLALLISVTVAIFGGIGTTLVTSAMSLNITDSSSRLVTYINSEYSNQLNIYGLASGLRLIICCLMIAYHNKLIRVWKYNEILIPAFIYSSCAYYFFSDYGIIASRIDDLIGTLSIAAALPTFILLFRKTSRIIPIVATIAYSAAFLVHNLASSPGVIYQSVLTATS